MIETNEKNDKKSFMSKSSESNSVVKPNKKSTKKFFFQSNKKKVTNSKIKKSSNQTKTMSSDLDTILKTNPSSQISEYYDLPYRYNQTIIKILAQTPYAIFIYWDIANSDRADMIKKYGENFFNETEPILLVHNKTKNYSFEVKIDDFTNSWYLRVPTSNCVFNIELGRKPKSNSTIDLKTEGNILHIASSNTIESPNDHVLNYSNTIYFKNIKNNNLEEKNISELKPVEGIYDLYQNEFINNPSSDFKI